LGQSKYTPLAIPKIIHQTYSSWEEVPTVARFHIWNMRRMNPKYTYKFYDDQAIKQFLEEEFKTNILHQYNKLTIGAAKADFFRYALLLKKGGVYVDIDSRVTGNLDNWIKPNDEAIITQERHPNMYVQWALIYNKNHPFLKRTLELVLDNIENNRHPNNVHKMTGPSVYSQAIQECMKKNPTILYREFGIDYNQKINAKFWLSRLSFRKKEHWKHAQKTKSLVKQ